MGDFRPGWQRAALAGGAGGPAQRVAENDRPAVSFAAKARADIAVGTRVFHEKFGYGEIADIDGNKLEVEFEQAGSKRVLDSFVKLA